MQHTLKFKAAEVQRILDHLRASRVHRALYLQQPKAAVLLAHDEGVYLMSSGLPPDRMPTGGNFVAYAEGCNPKTDPEHWHTSRALVGGDDFVEALPWIDEIEAGLKRGATAITIDISEDEIVLGTVEVSP